MELYTAVLPAQCSMNLNVNLKFNLSDL